LVRTLAHGVNGGEHFIGEFLVKDVFDDGHSVSVSNPLHVQTRMDLSKLPTSRLRLVADTSGPMTIFNDPSAPAPGVLPSSVVAQEPQSDPMAAPSAPIGGFVSASPAPSVPAAPAVVDGHPEYFVQRIVDHRAGKNGTEYRVRWQGFGRRDDTWEPVESLMGNERWEKYNRDHSLPFPPGYADPAAPDVDESEAEVGVDVWTAGVEVPVMERISRRERAASARALRARRRLDR